MAGYFPDRPRITRLAPNEIFSPPNKIHREVGRAKDLSAPLHVRVYRLSSYCSVNTHRLGYKNQSLNAVYCNNLEELSNTL